jgi:hypothetical protein
VPVSLPPPPPPGSMPPSGGPFPPPHSGGPGGYPGAGFPQSWPQVPVQPSSPKRGNGWKWGLGAVALLAVVGVTAAVTLSVTDHGDGSPATTQTAGAGTSNSDIASANDAGPVTVITEDPTCAPKYPILETFGKGLKNGWDTRDESIPATAWTPELRAQYEQVGRVMRSTADQLVPLAKLTPHRVMRELYEQFIVYARAYVDSFPTYTQKNDDLVRVVIATNDAVISICAAIDNGSAAARGPLISPPSPPSDLPPVGNPAEPEMFLKQPNAVCGDWGAALTQFGNDTSEWNATDPNIPASQWPPEQKALNEAVAPSMEVLASKLALLGKRSGNPTFRDFADLAAQYRFAYVKAIPTYIPADSWLVTSSRKLSTIVQSACQVVGG